MSAADLRIAQGQVRCGRCLAVFNALLALYDEPPGRKAGARSDRQERSSAERSSAVERSGTTERSSSAERGGAMERSGVLNPRNTATSGTLAAVPVPEAEPALQRESQPELPQAPVPASTATPVATTEPAREPEPAPQPIDPPASAPQTNAPDTVDVAVDEVPSEIIARDIIAAGFVEETISATADTGVNPVLDVQDPSAQNLQDPAATDVNVATEAQQEAAASAEPPPAEIPEAANEELIEDTPAANDPFIVGEESAAPAEAELLPIVDDDTETVTEPVTEPAAEPATEQELAAEPAAEHSAVAEQAPNEYLEPQPAEPEAPRGNAAVGIDLADEDDDFGTLRVIVPAAVAAAATAPAVESAVEPLFQRDPDRVPEAPAELELVESPAQAVEESVETELAPPAPRRRTALWAAGVALCTLLLCMQLVHVNRAALALNPALGPSLRSVYARLGMPIAPHWDVSAYDVTQQGAVGTADATAPLTVRASIVNRAKHEQPMPLLRVTLQDRFGNRIALRDLQPREYLPGKPGKTPAILAAGQRVDAEVAMADPGGKAVGFEIDACLQVLPGRYSCANDQPVDHGTTAAAR